MDLEGEEEKSQGGVHLQYKQIRESVVKNTSRWTVNDKHIIMTPLTKVSLNCHRVGLDNNFKDEGRTNNRVRAKLNEKRKLFHWIHPYINKKIYYTHKRSREIWSRAPVAKACNLSHGTRGHGCLIFLYILTVNKKDPSMQEMHEIQGWPAEHSQNYLNPSIIILLEEIDAIRDEWPYGTKIWSITSDANVRGAINCKLPR